MRTPFNAALFGGALFLAGLAEAGDTYRIDGPSNVAAPASYGYAWGGAIGAELGYFRAFLEDVANFSHLPAAAYDARIITDTFDVLGNVTLANADCVISPYWLDVDTSAYDLFFAQEFFLNGGDLILLNPNADSDAIGEDLGIPTSTGTEGSVVMSGTSFLFDGPFGVAVAPELIADVGHLNPGDVTGTGGQVLATDALGRPVVAFWKEGDYAPGAGKMIIVTDATWITNGFGAFDPFDPLDPLEDNGRFALNMVAGMIADTKPGGADCDRNGVLNVDDIDCFVDSFLNGEL